MRSRRWWTVAFLGGAFLLAWMFFSTLRDEPVYQGRHLGKWLRGHPRDYAPAVRALGTNALPYLLAELQATDSRMGGWGEAMLAKASIGPFWRTARQRRYCAGLGLQILDTNAATALADMIFSKPMKVVDGDASYSAAMALRWMGTEAAQGQVCGRLTQALHSADGEQRRNACLVLSFLPYPGDDFRASLAMLSRDASAQVRAAAVRAIIFSVWQEDLFLPALLSRLEDEQAAVRRLAIAGLNNRGTNAVGALPVLRTAYSNELAQSNLRGDLGDGAFGNHSWSATEIRWAIRDAIKAIDPGGPLPADPP